jgi:hypothetical protein
VTETKNAIKLTEDLDSEYNGLYSMIKREREKYGAGREAVAGCLLEAYGYYIQAVPSQHYYLSLFDLVFFRLSTLSKSKINYHRGKSLIHFCYVFLFFI